MSPAGRARWPGAPWKCINIDEPCCFGCGYSREHESSDWRRAWMVSGLDRAHVVGIAEGGSDDISNLVLLCGRCHREHPRTHLARETFEWLDKRESWMDALARRIRAEAARQGVDLDATARVLNVDGEARGAEFLAALYVELGFHPVELGSFAFANVAGLVALLGRMAKKKKAAETWRRAIRSFSE
jgi:HNH endonuclease